MDGEEIYMLPVKTVKMVVTGLEVSYQDPKGKTAKLPYIEELGDIYLPFLFLVLGS